MQSATISARQARSHYRHQLRTLTYVTLDEANGGIVRNLSHEGVAVQAVAALREQQHVRLRFELRFPRLRVDAHGQVSWTSSSGQCGVRFLDLPTRTRRQIDEWIFSNLLDSLVGHEERAHSIFGARAASISREEDNGENDGLTLSAVTRPPIRLETKILRAELHADQDSEQDDSELSREPHGELSWLAQPLSARTLAWLVDGLVVSAALLLFALIFLSIAHELPRWPLTLSAVFAAAVFVSAAYWFLFAVFGAPSLGARLAGEASSGEEEEDGEADRFR